MKKRFLCLLLLSGALLTGGCEMWSRFDSLGAPEGMGEYSAPSSAGGSGGSAASLSSAKAARTEGDAAPSAPPVEPLPFDIVSPEEAPPLVTPLSAPPLPDTQHVPAIPDMPLPPSKADVVPTVPKTPLSVDLFNLEAPFRCSVNETTKSISQTIPFRKDAFTLERAERFDPLPKYAVKNFSFKNLEADKVYAKLLADTSIAVLPVDPPYPALSATGMNGEIEDVLTEISETSGVYYRYNMKRHYLEVSRYAEWALKLPPHPSVLLAMLDALRGIGVNDITTDWHDFTLTFKGDKVTEARVRHLMSLFQTEPMLVAFDVALLRITPKRMTVPRVDWQELIEYFGTARIKVSKEGNLGKILLVDKDVTRNALIAFLRPRAHVAMMAEGQFTVSDQWRSRFEIGRCGRMDAAEFRLSLLAEADILKDEKMAMKLVLDSVRGEISSYDITGRQDEHLLVIGVPTNALSPNIPEGSEIAVLLRPRLIRLVKAEQLRQTQPPVILPDSSGFSLPEND